MRTFKPAQSKPFAGLAKSPPKAAAPSGSLVERFGIRFEDVPVLDRAADEPRRAHELAARGTRGAGGPLPHLDKIQRSFGRHDLSGIQSHTGEEARDAAGSLGARAFTTGGRHVAFAGAPSLSTAAHEAAHAVQQRSGAGPARGLDSAGDRFERHADRVAERVVRGQSSEALLEPFAGQNCGAASPVVQRQIHVNPHDYVLSKTKGAIVEPEVVGQHLAAYRLAPVNDQNETFDQVLDYAIANATLPAHREQLQASRDEFEMHYRAGDFEKALELMWTLANTVNSLFATFKIPAPPRAAPSGGDPQKKETKEKETKTKPPEKPAIDPKTDLAEPKGKPSPAAKKIADGDSKSEPAHDEDPSMRLHEIYTTLPTMMEQDGLYGALWGIYRTSENLRDPIPAAMKLLEDFFNAFSKSKTVTKWSAGELTDEDRPALDTIFRYWDDVQRGLHNAWAIVNKQQLSDSKNAGPSHAAGVLEAMKAGADAEAWTAASAKMRDAIRAGEVVGTRAVIAKIGALIDKYQLLWKSLASDGLKGASNKILIEMETVRMTIVKLIADSDDLDMMVCAGPGTDFYRYMQSLAKQSCGSRDVQMFADWWAKNGKGK